MSGCVRFVDLLPEDQLPDGDGDGDIDGDSDGDGDGNAEMDGDFEVDGDGDADGDDDTVTHDVQAFKNELLDSFLVTQVPAIDADGSLLGYDIGVVDSELLDIVACSVTLTGTPEETQNWVGGASCVAVILDINAVTHEQPYSSEDDRWTSAGIIIRSVFMTEGSLVVPVSLSTQDKNLIDSGPDGIFERDYYTPFDTQIEPQLVEPVRAIKEIILEAFTS